MVPGNGSRNVRLLASVDGMTRQLSDLSWPRSTARLTLRPATAEDVAAIYAYRRLPEMGQWLTQLPGDEESFSQRVTGRLASMVAIEHEGRLVGDLLVRVHDGWSQVEVAERARNTQAEIGWGLDPTSQGQGFAAEAVSELITIAFELGVRRVEANCFADNKASWRLMERVGMRRESHYRRDTLHRDGTWRDSLIYGLLADEWAPR